MRDLADELLQAKVKARLFGGDHAPRLGRLVILDRLGAGAMGTVYAAYDPRLDRKVAIKVMHAADPDASARFLRECRALARLAHPNIITIHDAGEDTGSVHVVMELATGVPLRAWIDNPDRTWRDVVRVMTEVAAGLAAAHRANIVHRDVKPDNILVGSDRARLVDFGLAHEPEGGSTNDLGDTGATTRVADGSPPPIASLSGASLPSGSGSKLAANGSSADQFAATAAFTIDDHAAGTPSYMAPEILAGGAATAASDQFSFAVTLFEALYGERPYSGTTRAELREAAGRAADAVRRARSSTSSRKSESAAAPLKFTIAPLPTSPAKAPKAGSSPKVVSSTGPTISREDAEAEDAVAGDLPRDKSRGVASGERPPASGERPPTSDRTVLSEQPTVQFERRAAAVESVPAWIDAILRRALAADPANRFPSLDALAAELTRDRRRRQRAAVVVTLAMAVGGTLGALAYRAGGEPAAPPVEVVSCDGHPRAAEVWNAKRAENVRAELGDVAWGESTVAAMGTAAKAWEGSFKTVCEATRVRGEQSDRLLELRVRCLDRALDRLGALGDALTTSLDNAARAEAPSSIAMLPAPALCETLTDAAELQLPVDPAARTEATSIERELDHAWAAYSLGRYLAARTRATSLSQRAAKLDLPALHAAVLLLGGSIEGRTGEPIRARQLLDRAAVLAAAAHAPELELAVWTRMLRQELFIGHYERVIEWAATGEAAAARAGHEGAEISAIVGEANRAIGQLGVARKQLETALASHDVLREDTRALVEMNLGSIDLALGKSVIAEGVYQRAYDRSRRALGEGHPTLAIHLDKLAESARARGKLRTALEIHERSHELRRRAFGDNDRSLATAKFHHAETLVEIGLLDEAETEATAARAIRADAFGKHSVRLGELDALLGDIALARGRLADARVLFDRAGELDRELDINRRLTALVVGAPALLAARGTGPAGPLDRVRLAAAAAALGLTGDPNRAAPPGDPPAGSEPPLDPKRLAREAAMLEPFTVDRVAANAARLSLLPKDRAAPALAALLARYRTAGPVDAALSNAVADAMLAVGDRSSAAAIYSAALAATPEEPSRARLHAFRGLALAIDGDGATTAAASADALVARMPQLGAK